LTKEPMPPGELSYLREHGVAELIPLLQIHYLKQYIAACFKWTDTFQIKWGLGELPTFNQITSCANAKMQLIYCSIWESWRVIEFNTQMVTQEGCRLCRSSSEWYVIHYWKWSNRLTEPLWIQLLLHKHIPPLNSQIL
jgi:hypothetical protein